MMAEKTKLKWLRKEFSSSEELEYYLTQLKHQDKLKSDIISLLQRFQHLLFTSYEPDYLTITYNGQWDISFGPAVAETAAGEQGKMKRIKNSASSSSDVATKRNVKTSTESSRATRSKRSAIAERVNLKTLLDAQLIDVGTRLRYKNRPSVIATITRDGHIRIGKNEYNSLSGAATSFVPSGRRDGWLYWLFQDQDGDWKPIDLLRDRWREMK
jgi:hypothetical protein